MRLFCSFYIGDSDISFTRLSKILCVLRVLLKLIFRYVLLYTYNFNKNTV